MWMAAYFACIFHVSGYFYRVFHDVWKSDNDYSDYALAVYVYVCNLAWR